MFVPDFDDGSAAQSEVDTLSAANFASLQGELRDALRKFRIHTTGALVLSLKGQLR